MCKRYELSAFFFYSRPLVFLIGFPYLFLMLAISVVRTARTAQYTKKTCSAKLPFSETTRWRLTCTNTLKVCFYKKKRMQLRHVEWEDLLRYQMSWTHLAQARRAQRLLHRLYPNTNAKRRQRSRTPRRQSALSVMKGLHNWVVLTSKPHVAMRIVIIAFEACSHMLLRMKPCYRSNAASKRSIQNILRTWPLLFWIKKLAWSLTTECGKSTRPIASIAQIRGVQCLLTWAGCR